MNDSDLDLILRGARLEVPAHVAQSAQAMSRVIATQATSRRCRRRWAIPVGVAWGHDVHGGGALRRSGTRWTVVCVDQRRRPWGCADFCRVRGRSGRSERGLTSRTRPMQTWSGSTMRFDATCGRWVTTGSQRARCRLTATRSRLPGNPSSRTTSLAWRGGAASPTTTGSTWPQSACSAILCPRARHDGRRRRQGEVVDVGEFHRSSRPLHAPGPQWRGRQGSCVAPWGGPGCCSTITARACAVRAWQTRCGHR